MKYRLIKINVGLFSVNKSLWSISLVECIDFIWWVSVSLCTCKNTKPIPFKLCVLSCLESESLKGTFYLCFSGLNGYILKTLYDWTLGWTHKVCRRSETRRGRSESMSRRPKRRWSHVRLNPWQAAMSVSSINQCVCVTFVQETDRLTDRLTDRQTERQTNRQTDSWVDGRPMDRQTVESNDGIVAR